MYAKFNGNRKKNFIIQIKNKIKNKKIQKDYIFMIKEDWNFCEQTLQVLAFSNGMLRIFIFVFFNLISSFLKSIFHFNIFKYYLKKSTTIIFS